MIPAHLSIEEFRETVGDRETGTLEFKEALPRTGKLQEPLVAFANGRGGVIAVGISKNLPARPVGLVWGQSEEERIQEAARATNPQLQVEVSEHEVDGERVVLLGVEPVEGWIQTSDGRVLVRAGPTNRTLFGTELLRFLRARSDTPVEEEAVAGASVEGLDPPSLHAYVQSRLGRVPRGAQDLIDVGLLTASGEVKLATLLMFGLDPQAFHRRLNVSVLRFAGSYSGRPALRDRQELTGSIPELVAQADRRIYDEMRRESVIRGLVREEVPEYPALVVREALVNALAHRDYSLTGSSVEVRIYDDALEIESPGALPGYVTVDNLRDAQFSRNERIMDALERLGYVEEAGQGIDRMIDEMEDALLERPKFEERDQSFVVRLRGTSVFAAEDRVWVSTFGEFKLSAEAKVALVYAKRNGSIKNEELRTLRSVDREESRAVLQELVAKGLLRKLGRRGGTHYTLAELALSQALQLSLDDRSAVVLAHAKRQGSVANADVRGLLGVDATTARGILQDLVAQGTLEARGERRGRHYVPRASG